MHDLLGFVGLNFDVYKSESLISICEFGFNTVNLKPDGIDHVMGIRELEGWKSRVCAEVWICFMTLGR